MKTKKLDNSVRRHFAEHKVFYNKRLNKNFGGAQYPGHRDQNLCSVIYFVLNLSPTSGRLIRKLLRSISYD